MKKISTVFTALSCFLFTFSTLVCAAESANFALRTTGFTTAGESISSAAYALRHTAVGGCIGGTAQTDAFYTIESGYTPQSELIYDILASIPPQPCIDSVSSATGEAILTLTGTKSTDSVVIELTSDTASIGTVSLPTSTTWQAETTLSVGTNLITVTAKNIYGTSSVGAVVSIVYDDTPPVMNSVSDAGGQTTLTSALTVSWSATDAETDIDGISYSVGSTAGGTDISDWTAANNTGSMTISGLNLSQGGTYYINLKAQNNAGTWSAVATTDGITVNQSQPVMSSVLPASGDMVYAGTTTVITATAADSDGDSLEYRFMIDGALMQNWSLSAIYNWAIVADAAGSTAMNVSVRDGNGGSAVSQYDVFIVKEPPFPGQ